MKLAISALAVAVVLSIGLLIALGMGWPRSDPVVAPSVERRDLSGFSSIFLGGGVELTLSQGDEYVVEVEASDGDPTALRTSIDGTTLDIHPGDGAGGFFGLFPPDYSVRVTLPELISLTVSVGGEVDGATPFTGEQLGIVARFGSEIDLEVEVASISIEASGGSDVDLTGTAGSATIHVIGGSDFSGGDFVAGDVAVDVGGGSEAFMTVTDRITGRVFGGSDLVFRGNPSSVEVESSGGGEVSRL